MSKNYNQLSDSAHAECIYICRHTCMHARTHTYIHTYMHAYTQIYMCIYICVFTNTHTHTHIHILWVSVRGYVCVYIHTYISHHYQEHPQQGHLLSFPLFLVPQSLGYHSINQSVLLSLLILKTYRACFHFCVSVLLSISLTSVCFLTQLFLFLSLLVIPSINHTIAHCATCSLIKIFLQLPNHYRITGRIHWL